MTGGPRTDMASPPLLISAEPCCHGGLEKAPLLRLPRFFVCSSLLHVYSIVDNWISCKGGGDKRRFIDFSGEPAESGESPEKGCGSSTSGRGLMQRARPGRRGARALAARVRSVAMAASGGPIQESALSAAAGFSLSSPLCPFTAERTSAWLFSKDLVCHLL